MGRICETNFEKVSYAKLNKIGQNVAFGINLFNIKYLDASKNLTARSVSS